MWIVVPDIQVAMYGCEIFSQGRFKAGLERLGWRVSCGVEGMYICPPVRSWVIYFK